MFLKEIYSEIEAGKLRVEAHPNGTRSRLIRVCSKTKGEWYMHGWQGKDGEWHEKKRWEGEFIKYERKTYPKIDYLACDNKQMCYRISKKIYDKYKN